MPRGSVHAIGPLLGYASDGGRGSWSREALSSTLAAPMGVVGADGSREVARSSLRHIAPTACRDSVRSGRAVGMAERE